MRLSKKISLSSKKQPPRELYAVQTQKRPEEQRGLATLTVSQINLDGWGVKIDTIEHYIC